MSRIGKKPIVVPDGVRVRVDGQAITVEGPKGKLDGSLRPEVAVRYDEAGRSIVVERHNDDRQSRAMHGLTRALVQNMVTGVTQGYQKRLEIHGVGYIAAVAGDTLELRVGYANELKKKIPPELQVTCPDQQHIVVQGIDKQKVGEFAAEVRALRKPEPYKGKGIRYEGEAIRRKQGKVMAK
jgi:large subunit ribosomal protein L6